MKTSERNDPRKAAQQTQPSNEIRSRGGQQATDKPKNPGGGGSQDRVAGKGNDISHEDDLLQGDIADEVDNALAADTTDGEYLIEGEDLADEYMAANEETAPSGGDKDEMDEDDEDEDEDDAEEDDGPNQRQARNATGAPRMREVERARDNKRGG